MSSGRGTHWVAWFKKGSSKFYFDSYGLEPPTELVDYLKSKIFNNTDQIQTADDVICGHLCLYILSLQSDGRHLQDIINDLI